MKQVIPYKLWLGHAGDGRDFRSMFQRNVEAVLQLALEEPMPAQVPRDLLYLRIPLVDGAGNNSSRLRLAVATLVQLLRLDVPTLVCCGAGLSRTPVIAALALSEVEQESPEACLQRISQVHGLDVSTAFWKQVITR